METRTLMMVVVGIAVLVIILVIIGTALWVMTRKRHTEALKDKFGPEYDYTVNQLGDQQKAEAELEIREKRFEELEIRELSSEEQTRYLRAWEQIQARFVDNPEGAVTQADDLIQDVMRDRGFPVADFEQRSTDLSVAYPTVVSNYRAGYDIAWRIGNEGVTTEDLRQAIVYYRSLFNELVQNEEKIS
jgi:hypothetical protein